MLTEPLSIISQQSWPTREVLVDWELAHVPSIGTEGVSGELQACQSELGARVGYGADHVENNHTAHTGQPEQQAQSGWVYERQVPLYQPDLL